MSWSPDKPNQPCGGDYCTPLTSHGGLNIGDTITFQDGGRPELLTGTIVEIHLEKHPNTLRWRPEGSVFAEVENAEGEWARCWFVRDKPALATALDGVLPGAQPEGAMF